MDTGTTPELSELYQLGEQIERDRSVSLQDLRQRDRAIGARCDAPNDVDKLLCWLRHLPEPEVTETASGEYWLSQRTVAIVARLTAAVLGFLGMTTFLLASGKGLVNVLVFLLVFVLVQFVFSMVALCVMLLSGNSETTVLLPLNPARLVVSRMLPDKRYLRECQSVVRLLLLRYGQELGALFTLGAVAAFFVVLAFSDFTFVWGSTFSLSDDFVRRATSVMAWPWSSWLPGASLPGEIISNSRYHPALTDLGSANLASMRGWWPFLVMAMVTYALLPRILLWLLSKVLYVRSMRRSFVRYPGSENILARMKAPMVRMQAHEPEEPGSSDRMEITLDYDLLLLNWAGALAASDRQCFIELMSVAPENMLSAGLGSLEEDEKTAQNINRLAPERLLVAVRSWEPPMADLQDFLATLSGLASCNLCLVPLPRRSVAPRNLQEWRDFARELPFDLVDARELTPL